MLKYAKSLPFCSLSVFRSHIVNMKTSSTSYSDLQLLQNQEILSKGIRIRHVLLSHKHLLHVGAQWGCNFFFWGKNIFHWLLCCEAQIFLEVNVFVSDICRTLIVLRYFWLRIWYSRIFQLYYFNNFCLDTSWYSMDTFWYAKGFRCYAMACPSIGLAYFILIS